MSSITYYAFHVAKLEILCCLNEHERHVRINAARITIANESKAASDRDHN